MPSPQAASSSSSTKESDKKTPAKAAEADTPDAQGRMWGNHYDKGSEQQVTGAPPQAAAAAASAPANRPQPAAAAAAPSAVSHVWPGWYHCSGSWPQDNTNGAGTENSHIAFNYFPSTYGGIPYTTIQVPAVVQVQFPWAIADDDADPLEIRASYDPQDTVAEFLNTFLTEKVPPLIWRLFQDHYEAPRFAVRIGWQSCFRLADFDKEEDPEFHFSLVSLAHPTAWWGLTDSMKDLRGPKDTTLLLKVGRSPLATVDNDAPLLHMKEDERQPGAKKKAKKRKRVELESEDVSSVEADKKDASKSRTKTSPESEEDAKPAAPKKKRAKTQPSKKDATPKGKTKTASQDAKPAPLKTTNKKANTQPPRPNKKDSHKAPKGKTKTDQSVGSDSEGEGAKPAPKKKRARSQTPKPSKDEAVDKDVSSVEADTRDAKNIKIKKKQEHDDDNAASSLLTEHRDNTTTTNRSKAKKAKASPVTPKKKVTTDSQSTEDNQLLPKKKIQKLKGKHRSPSSYVDNDEDEPETPQKKLLKFKEKHRSPLAYVDNDASDDNEERTPKTKNSVARDIYSVAKKSAKKSPEKDPKVKKDPKDTAKGTKSLNERWQTRFNELVEFKNKHGHCGVPTSYAQNRPLGRWVESQRGNGKKYPESGPMTKEHYQALDELGFVWVAKRGGPTKAESEKAEPKKKARPNKEDNASVGSAEATPQKPSASAEPKKINKEDNGVVESKEKNSSFRGNHLKVKKSSKKSPEKANPKSEQAALAPRAEKKALEGAQPSEFRDWSNRRWQTRFNQLVEFKHKHGHCHVGKYDPENKQLATWLETQQENGKKYPDSGPMTEEHYRALDELGFVWITKLRKDSMDERWQTRFNELVQFKNTHGHCRVPRSYAENKQLGRWVETQRLNGKKYPDSGPMTEEHYRALDDLGFVWVTRSSPKKEKLQKDNATVESTEATPEKSTASIEPEQPKRNKERPTKGLDKATPTEEGTTPESKKVKPVSKATKSKEQNERWQTRFNELVEFKKKHGHCRVPKSDGENKQLGIWVEVQRKNGKKYPDSGPMMEEHHRALDELGFVWVASRGKSTKKESETVATPNEEENANVESTDSSPEPKEIKPKENSTTSVTERKPKEECATPESKKGKQKEATWQENFKHLVEFQEKNGHCKVPYGYNEYPKLGVWVQTQRNQRKKYPHSGFMTEERIKALDQVGFIWEVNKGNSGSHETRWQKNFKQLVEYKKKHGHCQVPAVFKENSSLGSWVQQQRSQGKKYPHSGSITEERRKSLDGIGFIWEVNRRPTGKGNDAKKATSKVSGLSSEARWEERLKQLVEYKSVHGHFDVAQDSNEYPKLGWWVHQQRIQGKKYPKSKFLTEHRYKALDEIGFFGN